ncbi:MAG: alpha-amylase family glycosyl hydrolase, partial [Bacteroidaceae bacterium]
DGTKKGLTSDAFIAVTDNKYEGFTPDATAVINETLPTGLKYGINKIDNQSVTIVLYDKDTIGNHHDYAYVIGDMNNWLLTNNESSQMKRDDTAGCWWITFDGLDPDKEYRFQYYIGDGANAFRMADAYSTKILDPNNDKYILESTYPSSEIQYPEHGASGILTCFKLNETAYNWEVTDFKIDDPEDLVIYEVLLRDFTDSRDIDGLMSKLDYIKGLGVDAIELMPLQEFDGNNSWGYNPSFFFALDKAYGTPLDYKKMIDACHKKGLAVILDVVYNHATGDNPLARLYWDSSDSKTASNNPYFNVDAPHPYSVFHDFNHESALTRQFIKRNITYILNEYKFDGFRFDLVKGFTQKNTTDATAGNYDVSRVAILKDYQESMLEANPNAMMILEFLGGAQEEDIYAANNMFCWRNMNEAYCKTGMGWSTDSDLSGTYNALSNRVAYQESHDEERVAFKQRMYGNYNLKRTYPNPDATALNDGMNQLKINAAFFLLVPGPKMIWQFGELGYDISIEEGDRTSEKPILWNYYDVSSRKSLYDTYAKLMELRNENPELFDDDALFSWKVSTSYWDNGRTLTLEKGPKHIVAVGNFSGPEGAASADAVTFPHTGDWTDYLSSESLNVTDATTDINLSAYQVKVYTDF